MMAALMASLSLAGAAAQPAPGNLCPQPAPPAPTRIEQDMADRYSQRAPRRIQDQIDLRSHEGDGYT